ncbi:choline/ethanolaminephosphotransferase 1 [Capsaspora owczarzaki ATCC 30864]|nr:choline/ethanolaminephosphotransferase 1 [Capsaspora owczarzaki ATCC 30864]|eukprot:XP_004349905.1 choline/ethanolaminephosphotransferase 1 [Capsaspora owczarzaki ATCC 30864]
MSAPYLTPAHVKGMREHKYACSTNSYLDLHVMVHFWNWLVKLVPLWVAPNLITMVGLIVNVATSVILLSFVPTGQGEAPRWAYGACALGLFIYQSLDAIDGKQARRTNTSSPLGELFDHGCDSVSMAFLALAGGAAMSVGPTSTLLVLSLLFNFIFFCAHWQTYVRGTMIFGVVDVTEGQMAVILVHLLTFFFGSSWWLEETFGVPRNMLIIAVSSSGIILMFFRTFQTIAQHDPNKGTVANTSVVSPIIPCIILFVCTYISYHNSAIGLYQTHPVVFIFAFSVCFAKITNQMVIAHMSKMPFPLYDRVLLAPIALTANIYFFNSAVDELVALYVFVGVALFDLIWSSYFICNEMCVAFGIKCFTIPYPPSGAAAATSSGPVTRSASAKRS